MKRIYTLILFLIFMLSAGAAFGQNSEPWRLAVYATGNVSQSIKDITQNKVATILTNTGKYRLAERSREFVEAIAKEIANQYSGGVEDDQITALGHEYGANYVCVVQITNPADYKNYIQIAMRMLNVEKKTSDKAGEAESNSYHGPADINGVVQAAVNMMLGNGNSSSSHFTANSSMPTNGSRGTSNLTIQVRGVSFEMIYVRGGTFTMGGTSEQGSDADDDEYPVHQVTLSDYYIGKFEVTQALWQAVMGSNPSHFKNGDEYPVEEVSYYDVQEFLSELNRMTGKNFYLPTEAQWEFAARGGTQSQHYKYSGGNVMDDVGWYEGNSGSKTHTVGMKRPNELGIYDMSGNVWEWCLDWYGSYGSSSQRDPAGASSGSYRVLRGGSWYYYADNCRVSSRDYYDPDHHDSADGFRLVLIP